MEKRFALLITLFAMVLLSGCGQLESVRFDTDASVWSADKIIAIPVADVQGTAVISLQGEMEHSSLELLWEQNGESCVITTPTLNGLGPEEPSIPDITPFDSLMGHTGFIESHRRAGTNWSERFYYAMDFEGVKAPVCIGESCGYQADDYLVDLDGDGRQELVCNSTYIELSDAFVTVYREAEGKVWKSTIDLSRMLGDTTPELAAFLVSENQSRYDSEHGCFLFRYRDESGEWLEQEAAWPEAFTEEEYQLEEQFFRYQ